MKSQKGQTKGINLIPCKSCGRMIHYVETRNHRRMPCHDKKVTVITLLGDVVTGWETHWGSCPEADNFRKGR